jgi:hypothetical protein
MKLHELVMLHGLQKTLLLVDKQTKFAILNYIPKWVENCENLIKLASEIYNITQGKRQQHLWLTTTNKKLTYGEVFTKMLDLDEKISEIYLSDWIFNNIMFITEEGNWELQNQLKIEFTGARELEYGGENIKRNQFLKGQRKLKWMIIHIDRFIKTGITLLSS